MQTQLGLGGLSPGVASAAPLPARLRLSPVSTRKSEQAPLSSWSIVRGAHGRESDAWWSIPYLIVLCPGVVRRPTVEPLPDTGDVATPGYPCRGLVSEGLLVTDPTLHTPHTTSRTQERRYGLGGGGERGGVDRVSVSVERRLFFLCCCGRVGRGLASGGPVASRQRSRLGRFTRPRDPCA